VVSSARSNAQCVSHPQVAGAEGLGFFRPRRRIKHKYTHTMKELLQSLVRHMLTFLAGLGTTLHAAGLIGVEDVSQVNQEGITLQTVLAGLLVMVLMRLAVRFGGKLFAAHKEDGQNGSGALLLLLGVAGLSGMGLPSCSSTGEVMVRGSYQDAQGNVYAYDPETGLAVKLSDAPKVEREK
jgi:hypothetical protein